MALGEPGDFIDGIEMRAENGMDLLSRSPRLDSVAEGQSPVWVEVNSNLESRLVAELPQVQP